MYSTPCLSHAAGSPCWLLATWLALWPVAAAAQAPAPANASPNQAQSRELTLEELLDVEVQSVFGASKFLQKITEAPAAVTVVTAEEITRYGWRTLADVLQSVRGFYVSDDRSWSYAGTRGFQRPGDYNTRMLLLVDGRRVNNNLYDSAAVGEDFIIALADVDRIEVIRGPSSSLYGSNAFFGVINVITRRADGQSTVSAGGGTLGQWTGRARVSRALASGLKFSLSTTIDHSRGNERLYFAEYDDPQSNFGVAEALDYIRHRNLRAEVAFDGLTLDAGYNLRVRGMPTGAYESVFNDRRAQVSDEQFYASARGTKRLGSWLGEFHLGVDGYNYVGQYPYADDSDVGTALTTDTGSGRWLTGEAHFSRRLGARHRVTAGVEHRVNLAQNQHAIQERATNPDLDIRGRSSTSAAFAQGEWRLHRALLVNLGVRVDRYTGFANPVKPRVAAIYQPSEHTTVKLLHGRAFRAPNAYETDYTYPGLYKGNAQLRPEEIRTTEAIVEHYAGKRLRVSGSVFHYDVTGLIDLTLDPADDLNYYSNLNAVQATGVETEVEAKWPGGIQARLSHTFARARNADMDEPLTNSPQHVVQALFSTPLVARFVVGLDVRAMSSRLSPNGGPVPGHLVSNLTVSGPIADDRLRVSFTVSNVADRVYADPVASDFRQVAVPQNGRTARLHLSWKF